MSTIKSARAAIIRDKKILIMKSGKAPWELPGGWVGCNTVEVDYLKRTLPEWFRGIRLTDNFTYVDCFRDKKSRCEVYVAEMVGNINGVLEKSLQYKWIDYNQRVKYKFREFNLDIIERLRDDGRI